MMQREVAERLIAQPRTKAYGILSVAVQQFTEARGRRERKPLPIETGAAPLLPEDPGDSDSRVAKQMEGPPSLAPPTSADPDADVDSGAEAPNV